MNYSKTLDKQIVNKSQNYYSNFDYIMHDYMIKKFKPKFSGNNALELGAGSGNFTTKLDSLFKNLKVIEGSSKSRTVIIEFSDYETAFACYNSSEYRKALDIRKDISAGDLVIVEGV